MVNFCWFMDPYYYRTFSAMTPERSSLRDKAELISCKFSNRDFKEMYGPRLRELIADAIESFVLEAVKDLYPKWEVEAEKRDARKEALEEIYQLVYFKISANSTVSEVASLIRSLISKDAGGQKS